MTLRKRRKARRIYQEVITGKKVVSAEEFLQMTAWMERYDSCNPAHETPAFLRALLPATSPPPKTTP